MKTRRVIARRAGRPAGELAFTLVEVMLALAIFSMVLASLYTSWSAIMGGSKVGLEAAASVQRCRVAVKALEDALTTAQIYAGSPNRYWFVADTKGEFASLDMVAHLPETFPGSGLFGEQSLRRISFEVEPGAFSRNQLVLRQWPLLTPPNMGPDSEPYKIVLGRDVDLFKMEFWDPVKKDWVDEWSRTNIFPPLVKVAIGMGNPEHVRVNEREIITRVIAPPSIVVPREYQMPGAPLNPRDALRPPTNNPAVPPDMLQIPPPPQ